MQPAHRPTDQKRSILLPQASLDAIAQVTEMWSERRRQKLPLYLFLALCFNLVIAPVVYAAADGGFSRTQSWALGLLGLSTVALAIYLFFVMFAPEKF